VIEYLDRQYPGKTPLIPKDPAQALETRLRDRLCDLYLHLPMQKIVGDNLRPDDKRDPYGVEEARAQIDTSLRILEDILAKRTWIAGEAFTMADCAAAAPLFYIDTVVAPLADTHKTRHRLSAPAERAAVLRTGARRGEAVSAPRSPVREFEEIED
jgi:glutathione S-transferase